MSTCHPFACLHPDSATESEFSPEEILAEIATGVRGKAMGTFHEPVRFRSATHEPHPVRRFMESLLGLATVHSDHEPNRIPLNRPSGTFSPIGGEGWDEGVRFR